MKSSTFSGAAVTSSEVFSKVQERIYDLENRSLRSNVLFYGVDVPNKSKAWDEPERLVKQFRTNKLELCRL